MCYLKHTKSMFGDYMSRNKYPEETVTLILDVAQKLFIEKGYEHTTLQDIIDNLGGLTKGAIYHHFKSKEDILKAVSNRLFGVNTLSAKWERTKADPTMTGAEKLKKMFYDAVTDEQENKFRQMGIHLQNMPEMLSSLLLRSVNEMAPNTIQPVIEQGMKDGTIKTDKPAELAQMLFLALNIWLNPMVFPVSEEELNKKIVFARELFLPYGIDMAELYDGYANLNRL